VVVPVASAASPRSSRLPTTATTTAGGRHNNTIPPPLPLPRSSQSQLLLLSLPDQPPRFVFRSLDSSFLDLLLQTPFFFFPFSFGFLFCSPRSAAAFSLGFFFGCH
jgi:hypothetical protein